MRNDCARQRIGAYALGLWMAALCAFAAAQQPGPGDPRVRNETSEAVRTPETMIRDWPERSRLAARALILKYGEPDIAEAGRFVWEGNGRWEETVLYRNPPLGADAKPHGDVLEQSIPYGMSSRKLAEIKRFDDRLEYDRSRGALSARSDREPYNYLALNLANEIATGKRSAEDARAFYRKTIGLSESGKSSPYMEDFLFPVNRR
jgi:hypothetical protein